MHPAQTRICNLLRDQSVALGFLYEFIDDRESGGTLLRHRDRHLYDIEASSKNCCARQVRSNSMCQMDVFAIDVGTTVGQSLTRRREPTGNTNDFRVLDVARQKTVGRRTLRYCDPDAWAVDFVLSERSGRAT